MRIKKKIFTEKIEGIPIMFFNPIYKTLVKEELKNKFGVYALYDKKGKLYYVGIAQNNIAGRIKQHLKNKHKGKWQFFSVYFTKKKNFIKILEDAFISIVLPKGNIQKPIKINKGNRRIRRKMDIIYKNKSKPMSHLRVKTKKLSALKFYKKKSRVKKSRENNGLSLKNYFKNNKTLHKTYKGKTYKAILLKSGKIKYKNKLYKSPSGAAKVIVHRHSPNSGVNGWTFWSIKDSNNNWVRLSDLN